MTTKLIFHAKFYGVPCWFNIDSKELIGKNWFYDWLLNWVAIPFSGFVEWACALINPLHEPQFPIKLGPKRNETE